MKTLRELTQLLTAERKRRGLSQKDMYMLIGMSQQQYQRVEAGQDLKVSTLLRILAGLNMELSIVDPFAGTATPLNPDNTEDTVWDELHRHLQD